MRRTLELGQRVELQSMDPHCHDISLGLYHQESEGGSVYVIHTYSSHPDGGLRIEAICRGLIEVAGMLVVSRDPQLLAFPCGQRHEKAVRRSFLELCKLSNSEIGGFLPLVRPDKKAECDLTVEVNGPGRYRITAAEDGEKGKRRCQAVARGFSKLCEMDVSASDLSMVSFDCGHEHDRLMGALFFRAQNVRSAFKEDELASSRGTLAAPGNQDGNA
jgi:hypothetical protein